MTNKQIVKEIRGIASDVNDYSRGTIEDMLLELADKIEQV